MCCFSSNQIDLSQFRQQKDAMTNKPYCLLINMTAYSFVLVESSVDVHYYTTESSSLIDHVCVSGDN